ncbi:MAG: C-GCAxxG-C-C family protein [Bacteroidales bacterium]|jgi:C_GCAxxG_C_C family probable redox protein
MDINPDKYKDNKAALSFLKGHNCAQSIVSAFGEQFGLSEELGLKLATGLGAGINYQGKTCGAVAGAFIVLGLRYGVNNETDIEGKERLRNMLDKFSEGFIQKYNSLECKSILGKDVSNEKELEELREKNVFREICPQFVATASELIENLLKE